uniref:Uncharacterized protein n=1 Tax=Peronospora matthiolae TaxID=2874970 RepID=A0AAV1T924_9STRA
MLLKYDISRQVHTNSCSSTWKIRGFTRSMLLDRDHDRHCHIIGSINIGSVAGIRLMLTLVQLLRHLELIRSERLFEYESTEQVDIPYCLRCILSSNPTHSLSLFGVL